MLYRYNHCLIHVLIQYLLLHSLFLLLTSGQQASTRPRQRANDAKEKTNHNPNPDTDHDADTNPTDKITSQTFAPFTRPDFSLPDTSPLTRPNTSPSLSARSSSFQIGIRSSDLSFFDALEEEV